MTNQTPSISRERKEQISALKKLIHHLEMLKDSGELSHSNSIDLEVELKKIKKEKESLESLQLQ
jgi:hypothetical protein